MQGENPQLDKTAKSNVGPQQFLSQQSTPPTRSFFSTYWIAAIFCIIIFVVFGSVGYFVLANRDKSEQSFQARNSSYPAKLRVTTTISQSSTLMHTTIT